LLEQANAGSAAFFANAIDTESKGIDLVITHKANFNKSNLRTDLSATFGQTSQVGDIHASEVLENADLVDTYFDEASRIYLEEAVPRIKLNLTFNSLPNLLFKRPLFEVFFYDIYTNQELKEKI